MPFFRKVFYGHRPINNKSSSVNHEGWSPLCESKSKAQHHFEVLAQKNRDLETIKAAVEQPYREVV